MRLRNFKNFREAILPLGPLTVLVGTNASGKSNLRDALRFLHGIGLGYGLPEIIGPKWGDGGVLQWRGIRGGTREIAFHGASEFGLDLACDDVDLLAEEYSIDVKIDVATGESRVVRERLGSSTSKHVLYENVGTTARFEDPAYFAGGDWSKMGIDVAQPILPQLDDAKLGTFGMRVRISRLRGLLRSIRFLEPVPDVMREPSAPGIRVLGDRGENLSSVLKALCAEPDLKESLLEWVRQLTPLDLVDLRFPADHRGRILVELVEAGGAVTSAESASDGTLRFLALAVALIAGGEADQRTCFVLEEIDTGIHPTRLHLLLQLLEQQTSNRRVQVVATTHSPQVLTLLSPEALEHAVLVYRLQGHAEGAIRRIVELPEARRLIASQDLARLHASGWLEDAVEFTEDAGGEVRPG